MKRATSSTRRRGGDQRRKGRDYHARTHVTVAGFLATNWARFISRRVRAHIIQQIRSYPDSGGGVGVCKKKSERSGTISTTSRRKDQRTLAHTDFPPALASSFSRHIWRIPLHVLRRSIRKPERRNVSSNPPTCVCVCLFVCLFYFLCDGWFCALFLECTNFKNTLLLAAPVCCTCSLLLLLLLMPSKLLLHTFKHITKNLCGCGCACVYLGLCLIISSSRPRLPLISGEERLFCCCCC